MTQFRYRAIDSRGKISMGSLDAANESDLELRLGRLGLDMISSTEEKKRLRSGGRPIKRQEIITFCFHLEQLTRAGVPLLEGLSDLRDTIDHPRFREVIAAVIESIEGGATLSEAMADYPQVFDNVMISLIQAGEQTGELAEVFKNLTETLKWQDEQIARTKKLLTYPAVVGIFVVGVIFFLMTYLVPQLVGFITAMGKELPAHTRALLFVSDIFKNYWVYMLIAPFVIYAVIKYIARVNDDMRYQVDSLKLKMFIVGPLLNKIILARFANYFALMYASGITVLESIRICQDIVDNRAVSEALGRAGRQIADGASISASFEFAGLFPPLVLRMLKVGENTGALDSAMLNISYFYNRDVQEGIDKIQTLIEPTMTVLLGAILAWVMFSVLGPIYDLITTLKI